MIKRQEYLKAIATVKEYELQQTIEALRVEFNGAISDHNFGDILLGRSESASTLGLSVEKFDSVSKDIKSVRAINGRILYSHNSLMKFYYSNIVCSNNTEQQ